MGNAALPPAKLQARSLTAGGGAQAPVWAPTPVPALAGAVLVRPGQHHTLALAASGALLSAGRPTYGRLGRAGADPASDDALPVPASVEGLDGVDVAGAAAGALLTASAGGACVGGAGAGAVVALRLGSTAARPFVTGRLCCAGRRTVRSGARVASPLAAAPGCAAGLPRAGRVHAAAAC